MSDWWMLPGHSAGLLHNSSSSHHPCLPSISGCSIVHRVRRLGHANRRHYKTTILHLLICGCAEIRQCLASRIQYSSLVSSRGHGSVKRVRTCKVIQYAFRSHCLLTSKAGSLRYINDLRLHGTPSSFKRVPKLIDLPCLHASLTPA